MDVTLHHPPQRRHGREWLPLLLRIDTPIEVDYYLNAGSCRSYLRELVCAG